MLYILFEDLKELIFKVIMITFLWPVFLFVILGALIYSRFLKIMREST